MGRGVGLRRAHADETQHQSELQDSPLSSERVLYRLDIFDIFGSFSTQLESPDETVTGAARFAGGTDVL